MNLRDIEYFVAVADLGHFGQAAEKCFVSQPTLSGQLKKLEEELGHPLFYRNTRTVSLTPFGREALEIARTISRGSEALTRKARELDDPFSGTITLASFPTLCPWVFPPLVPVFTHEYPSLTIKLIEEKTPVLRTRLVEGGIDAALLALPENIEGIEAIPLFSEPFFLTVSEKHEWAGRESIEPAELLGLTLLLLEDGHCLRDQALDLCGNHGAREDGAFRATSLETLRQMVRLNYGITLMPRLSFRLRSEEEIRYIPISGTEAKRDIGLCFRAIHPRRELFLDLAEKITKKVIALL